MIILDEREFLSKELSSKGFEVFDFFENHSVLSMDSFLKLELKRRADFLLVDTETLMKHPEKQESFKSILNTFLGAVFFHDHSNQKAQEWVKNEGGFLPKIIGEYSLPMPQLNWTILSNQLQFFWSLMEDQKKLQKHMVQFSVELDQVLQNAEVEMQKAKKINELLVPRRREEIKGIVFSNKYSAGDGGEGEFYDLIQTPSKIYQILISSQSYLISSALLGILGTHREKSFEPHTFITEAQAEIEAINSAKKKKSQVDLVVLELDLGNLSLTALTSAKVELCTQKGDVVSLKKDTPHTLTKGEKVIVFSSGFLFNWKEGNPHTNLYEFVKNQDGKQGHEILSELFIHLKAEGKKDFMRKDATVVLMEVNRHGMHKV